MTTSRRAALIFLVAATVAIVVAGVAYGLPAGLITAAGFVAAAALTHV